MRGSDRDQILNHLFWVNSNFLKCYILRAKFTYAAKSNIKEMEKTQASENGPRSPQVCSVPAILPDGQGYPWVSFHLRGPGHSSVFLTQLCLFLPSNSTNSLFRSSRLKKHDDISTIFYGVNGS